MATLKDLTARVRAGSLKVPERDYPSIRTLDTCVEYLEKKLAA
jgi:hypothetical protein